MSEHKATSDMFKSVSMPEVCEIAIEPLRPVVERRIESFSPAPSGTAITINPLYGCDMIVAHTLK